MPKSRLRNKARADLAQSRRRAQEGDHLAGLAHLADPEAEISAIREVERLTWIHERVSQRGWIGGIEDDHGEWEWRPADPNDEGDHATSLVAGPRHDSALVVTLDTANEGTVLVRYLTWPALVADLARIESHRIDQPAPPLPGGTRG